MRSPILLLKSQIAACAFAIAPERSEELASIIGVKNIELVLSDDKDFSIRVGVKSGATVLPIATLEYLWCCAYVFWVHYQEYVDAQGLGADAIDLATIPVASEALDLLSWSAGNLLRSGIESWPSGFPRPADHPPHGSPVHVANELFLAALAWIIHHEISHVVLEHGIGNRIYPVQKEKAADRRATDWIFSSSTVPAENKKRAMGMITAILSLHYLDSPGYSSEYVRSHPPSLERLDYCLTDSKIEDDHAACAFAAVSLQYHLAHCGLTPPLEGESFRDILSGFMVAFATHGR